MIQKPLAAFSKGIAIPLAPYLAQNTSHTAYPFHKVLEPLWTAAE